MADHVQMFELFAQIKEIAIGLSSPNVNTVDECISLWTRMMLADANHDDTVASNMRKLQEVSSKQIQKLLEGLGRMHSFSADRQRLLEICAQAMETTVSQERELQALESDFKNQREELLRKVKLLLRREHDKAAKRILDGQRLMNRIQEDLNEKIRQTEKKLVNADKGKNEALSDLTKIKAERDECMEQISKLMRELKAKSSELSYCKAELEKTSFTLEQRDIDYDRMTKKQNEDASKMKAELQRKFDELSKDLQDSQAGLRKMQAEAADLRSKLEKKEGEADKLGKDLDVKSRSFTDVRAMLVKEQTRADDLQIQLDQSAKMVRDTESMVLSVSEELRKLTCDISTTKESALAVAKKCIRKERLFAYDQLKVLQSQKCHVESALEKAEVEKANLLTLMHNIKQENEGHRNRMASKVAGRLLNRSRGMAFSSWQSNTRESLRLRRKAAIVVKKWLYSALAKTLHSWATRCSLVRKRKVVLSKVVGRWTNQTLSKGMTFWCGEVRKRKSVRKAARSTLRRWKDKVSASCRVVSSSIPLLVFTFFIFLFELFSIFVP
jgi:chromosome segregation ATPase